MSATRWILAALMLAAATGAGCESVIGADFGGAEPRLVDAGGAAGTGGAGDPSCVLAQPPERPAIPAAGDDVEIVFVMKAIHFGDGLDASGRPEYLDLGYDLDGLCTGPGREAAGCTAPDWLDLDLRDGDRGQDNSVGKLLLSQEATFAASIITSDQLNANVADGINAPTSVLRIRDFGGLGEDDRVEVDWFVTGALGSPPTFTGADAWPVLASTLADPEASTGAATVSHFRDPNAFVTQRVLVARFERVQIPLLDVYFNVQDLVLTGRLNPVIGTGEWRLEDGILTGWTTSQELLRVIPLIAESSFGVSLCTDNAANYPTVKRFICAAADLAEDGSTDGSALCLRHSVGARFEAAPGALGAPIAAPPQEGRCPPETDPANDTCAAPSL
jgi:hypothetical protein